MTKWLETDGKTKYGVVIYNFQSQGEHRLNLYIGDTVHILLQSPGWFYGYNTKTKHQKGIFPKSYVHIKDAKVEKSGSHVTITPKELPIVQEITTVLREWGSIWKNLYTNQQQTGSTSDFETIKNTANQLIEWRKEIMSRNLPLDELKQMQKTITHQIDLGNARLDLDLVVRDEEGNILDPTNTSTISLFRQHQRASKRIREDKYSTSDKESPWRNTSFNLFVNVKNFVCRIGEEADVHMNLYDGKQHEFISESFIMKWGNQGLPRDIDMLNNLRVLFTDLGVQDASREKVFLVCQIIRIGTMDLKDIADKKQPRGLRRPFGIAALDVTDFLKGRSDMDENKAHFIPFQQCGEKDFFENIIKKGVSVKEVNHKGQGLWINMRRIVGELKEVQKEYPHLALGTTAIARKMGFPDVILPGDVRNDLYVTLLQGEFKKGGKSSDKNVEVTMYVCNEKGEVVEDVESEGAGGQMSSQYKSVIYYHEDKPKWYETIKVAIPINDFYESHLKFTFKHRSTNEVLYHTVKGFVCLVQSAKDRSERPFAMSYVRLMKVNGTTLNDTVHDLLVYKYDDRKQRNRMVYLEAPSTTRDLRLQSQVSSPQSKITFTKGPYTLNPNDSFQISTLVCSTKLTHNVNLMRLLKWREHPNELKTHLVSFLQVEGEQVVKFLQDTLDALFNILMQNSDSDLYDSLVFDALIYVVGLVADIKYHQFRRVLDVYIQENFSATLAYDKLMVVLKSYIESVNGEAGKKRQESLLKAMKCLEYIFKFIIRSRVLFAALNENRGQPQFELSLKQVFQAINNLMQQSSDKLILIQGAVLKYLPTTIAEIMSVLDAKEFSHVLVNFINSVPKGKLTKQKMQCVNDIVHSPLFTLPEARRVLLPVIMVHASGLIENAEELEICSLILSDIMDLLFRQQGSTKEELSTITMSGLRTVIQTVITMDRNSPIIGNWVSVMTAILRQMTDYHYSCYINHFDLNIDLMDFLMEILMVFRDLVSKNVYPPDWNEMILLSNFAFLKALRCFSKTITEKFLNPFEYQVWNNFFHCAISFLTQKALQLENFSSTKRNKIISKYKDMRRLTGFEIRSMWFNLGAHKIKFIPEIVGPILEMTLIPEIELRKATIPIFFDMMQCEFLSYVTATQIKGSFTMFEDEIITKLDALVEGGRGDEQYRELFTEIMSKMCEQHMRMREMGLSLVETVKTLLQHLLEYRAIINDENKDNQMSCTVNLLSFYQDINRQEMYIRYLNKLCDLHLECDNYTEAAKTLMLYAGLLHWSDDPLPTLLLSNKHPEAETHRELKEQIYYSMIEYFDKGKMWEKGIELCKELAYQYETETFDYLQLSEILKKQAELYHRIMKQMRFEPEYFRVAYVGRGFPSFLQNKIFIFRGKEYERLTDFCARVQNQFPNAQLLKSLNPPSDEVKNSPGEYLQINAVQPIMELQRHLVNKRVGEQILKYYKANEVEKFTYSRKKDESKKDDVTTLWLERTNMVISQQLPGILRWFPVVSTKSYEVSPLENAMETMEQTNQKLKNLIEEHMDDPQLRVDPLGMVLSGVVDAAVSGGISNYKVFYTDDFRSNLVTERELNLLKKLTRLTSLQMFLLQVGLDVHRDKAPDTLLPFQAHMDQRFSQMKDYVETHYNIKLTEEDRNRFGHQTGLQLKRRTMAPSRQSETGLTLPRVGRKSQAKLTPLVGSRSQTVLGRSASAVGPSNSPVRESPTKIYSKVLSFQRSSIASAQGEAADNSPSPKSSPRSSIISIKTDKSDRNSQVIELNEQLTPQRPIRPDTERRSQAARPATTFTASPRPSPGRVTAGVSTRTTYVEQPPPLPRKHLHTEPTNTEIEAGPPIIPSKSPHRRTQNKPPPPLPHEALQQNAAPEIPARMSIRETRRESDA